MDVAERAKGSTTVLEEERQEQPGCTGLAGHVKEFDFYPKSRGRPLNGFKKGDNRIRFTFSKSSC